MNLQEHVEDKCQEIVDEILVNRQDLNNEDPEEVFDTYFEEKFNSHEYWWEFDHRKLSIQNVNELLDNFEEMRKEVGEPANEGLSVCYLLQLYGLWVGQSLKDKYLNLLKEGLEEQSDNE